jgi:hypothetical protein
VFFVLIAAAMACAAGRPSSGRSRPPAGGSPATKPCPSDGRRGWPLTVSIVELIGRPDEFVGKRVQIIGFVHLEFEGHGIYLHEEDSRLNITKNGLWLDFRGPSVERLCAPVEGPQDQYMIVEGVFRKGPAGHFGMWSGELTDLSRFEAWRW